MPATAQGRAAGKAPVSLCVVFAGVAVAPAGVPQRWQNFAPGVSDARQVEQTAPSSGAPQLAQKRPEAGAEHLGQVVDEVGGVVDGMAENLHRERRAGHRARCELSL